MLFKCKGEIQDYSEPLAVKQSEGKVTFFSISQFLSQWILSEDSDPARINLETDPLGTDNEGNAVYLKDIWPSNRDIAKAVTGVSHHMFTKEYTDVFTGEKSWRAIPVTDSETYKWNAGSTYIQNPPFFDAIDKPASAIEDIQGARILALFGDSITTDHISPAGAIKADSPAGLYLKSHGVKEKEFNSYGSRRGNHEVMMRGTFANIRIRNEMVKGVEGGYTLDADGQQMPIYDAAMHYQAQNIPLVVFAGKEYGTGSSRDWAAKGTLLLGVKAVITEGFERIHRSNLVGMGVLPLQFKSGQNRKTLALNGSERVDIHGMTNLKPGETITATIHRQNGSSETIELLCRIDTENELAYFRAGGILHYVLRNRLGTN